MAGAAHGTSHPASPVCRGCLVMCARNGTEAPPATGTKSEATRLAPHSHVVRSRVSLCPRANTLGPQAQQVGRLGRRWEAGAFKAIKLTK